MEVLFAYMGSLSAFSIFGLLSGLLSIYAFLPYIIDTAANRTQPQRASWLIWSVLSCVAFYSQIFEGASTSLWFAGVQVSGTVIIFILSIKMGTGQLLRRSDYYVLLAAAIGLALCFFTETAAYTLLITISISLLGGSVTVVKAFRDPDSETLSTWVISLIASMFAFFSVGKFDLILMAYPLYLLTLYSAIIIAMWLGRVVQREVTVRLDTTVVDICL